MKILLAFDGDEAGVRSALKTIPKILRYLPKQTIGNEYIPGVMMYEQTPFNRPLVLRMKRGVMTEAEAIQKFHPEIRRMPDWELESAIRHYQREVVECELARMPTDTMKAWAEVLTNEAARREYLAEHGAPKYDGGTEPQRKTVRERTNILKQYYTGDEFLSLFEDITGIRPMPYGRSWKYACPLHGDGVDRTPAGSLDIDRGLWHCFVCDSGGDIFHLLYAWRRMTFMEAFDELWARGSPHI